jgi:hypothetical protein
VARGYEVELFAWAEHDPGTLAKIEKQGVKVHSFSARNLAECIDATEKSIRQVNPDVLITEMNSALPTVWFERRVADIQMFYQAGLPYWPLKNLDGVFTGWSIDPEILEIDRNRCFYIPTPFGLPEYSGDVDNDLLSTERGKFPHGKLIGMYGRLSKITPEYIKAAAAIVDGLDDVTVIIGGPGDALPLKRAIAATRLSHRFVVVEDFVDAHIWGHMLDVFLDTYPQPGGLAVMEVIMKGKPVLYMEQSEVPIFGEFKLPELICGGLKYYIETGRRLLTDNDFYLRMARATFALSQAHPNEDDFANALSEAIEQSIHVTARRERDGAIQ